MRLGYVKAVCVVLVGPYRAKDLDDQMAMTVAGKPSAKPTHKRSIAVAKFGCLAHAHALSVE